MIRELHVYGSLKAVGASSAVGAQHLGIGRTLLAKAEEIAALHGYKQIAVISGIGVRGYYQKNGYQLQGSYMMKEFAAVAPSYGSRLLLGLVALAALLFSLTMVFLFGK